MDIRGAFALTGASIRTHKLRSVLAAIGVVLGIGTVIGVVTMGAGFQASILGGFTEQFSADLLAVGLENKETTNGPPTSPNVFAFTDHDLAEMAKVPQVKEVAATTPVPLATVKIGTADVRGLILQARSGPLQFGPLEKGRAATSDDEAVVANVTALHLMSVLGRSDVVGAKLTVTWPDPAGGMRSRDITVVGVEKPSSFFTQELVTAGPSFAPPTTLNGTLTHAWQTVAIRATSASAVDAVKNAVKSYLDTSSDAKDLKGDRLIFRYDTQADVVKLISSAISSFTAFIGALGAVALLVGLVGIANIMLVSVQERTREIGVMKATGATRGDVMLVFLVESCAICLVGAGIGIGLGMLMGLGLNAAIGNFSQPPVSIPFVLVPKWYAIAAGLGIVVGLVAGLYPAWRAAKTSPVQALSYE